MNSQQGEPIAMIDLRPSWPEKPHAVIRVSERRCQECGLRRIKMLAVPRQLGRDGALISPKLHIVCISRQNMFAESPFIDRQIVDIHIWLGEERNEALVDPKLDGTFASVFGAA
jgi:hypothetical protein